MIPFGGSGAVQETMMMVEFIGVSTQAVGGLSGAEGDPKVRGETSASHHTTGSTPCHRKYTTPQEVHVMELDPARTRFTQNKSSGKSTNQLFQNKGGEARLGHVSTRGLLCIFQMRIAPVLH